jgi:methyltransferase (TIGR00027 family)
VKEENMQEGKPSRTAIAAASMRAAHLLLDDEPKILRDTLALALSGVGDAAALRTTMDRIQTEIAQQTTPAFAQSFLRLGRGLAVWRSRYVEDALEQALQRGITQHVILGAGLDSFAYRRPESTEIMRVFEVDHPTTQHWKRTRLHAVGVEIPPTVTFVPLDFEQQTLQDGLRAGEYRLEEPAVFSWLGVTPYLTEDAIFRTLREVAALAAGTEIIFEYEVPEALLDAEGQHLEAATRAFATARGEPWFSVFDPSHLQAHVQALGFVVVEDIGPEEAHARYFAARRDGLGSLPFAHLMNAQVRSHQ